MTCPTGGNLRLKFTPMKLIGGSYVAVTGASLYTQSKGSKTANEILALAPLISQIAEVYTKVTQVLKKAQEEKWAANDTRWISIFAEADAALKIAEARLT